MYVAGIDAHTRYCVLVVVNKVGELVLGKTRVRADQPEKLLKALQPFRPLEGVVETSSSWPWLHDLLTDAGIGFVLAYAKKLRAIAEARYKSDEVDAELLARMRLAGLIPEVHATRADQRDWAVLVRHRARLVAQRTALANRIHAQLHVVGLYLERGRLLTRSGRRWLRTDAWPRLTPEQRLLVRTHLTLISRIQQIIRHLDRRIEQVSAQIPEARRLATVPGIGPCRALVICAEMLPVTRFASPAKLVSYAGLAPQTKKSGERPVRHGPIPGGANRWLRGTLVRTVVTHTRHTPESWLTQYYTQQKARVGWQVARIATARKLARAIHAMLRDGRDWSNAPEKGESSIHHMPLDGAKL